MFFLWTLCGYVQLLWVFGLMTEMLDGLGKWCQSVNRLDTSAISGHHRSVAELTHCSTWLRCGVRDDLHIVW